MGSRASLAKRPAASTTRPSVHHEMRRGYPQGLVRECGAFWWHHDVPRYWRAHDKGAHSLGALHDEDQGRGTSGAKVLGVDRRLDPVLVEHLPADVDLEGRVRRVRPYDCPPEMLLRYSSTRLDVLTEFKAAIDTHGSWQRLCCTERSSEVHSHRMGLWDQISHVRGLLCRRCVGVHMSTWMRMAESASMCFLGMHVQRCIPGPLLSHDLKYPCRLARARLRWTIVPETSPLGVGSRKVGVHVSGTSSRTP